MGVSQHPETGQFSTLFGQGYPDGIVNNTECDDAAHQAVEESERQEGLGQGVIEAVQHGLANAEPQNTGRLPQTVIDLAGSFRIKVNHGLIDQGAVAQSPVESIQVHVGTHTEKFTRNACNRDLDCPSVTLQHFQLNNVPGSNAQLFSEKIRQQQAFLWQLHPRQIAVHNELEFCIRGDAGHGAAPLTVTKREPRRHQSFSLDIENTGLSLKRVNSGAVDRIYERRSEVLLLHPRKLGVNHQGHRIKLKIAHHHDGCCHRNATH